MLILKNNISTISFCDKRCNNVNNNQFKEQLIELIDSNLSGHPKESDQLKGIVDEWANLKVESFENRRSWVRASKK